MRRFLLTAKIAVVFAVLVGFALVATFLLFADVVGHDLLREVHYLHAYQGVDVVRGLEAMARGRALDDPAVSAWLAAEAERRDLLLSLEPEVAGGATGRRHRSQPEFRVEIQGRTCLVFGPPRLGARVPVLRDGDPIAWLAVRGKLEKGETHHAFFVGLLQIGAVTLAAVGALAVYLTAPLRRMSRSMDRIAEGELEYRVAARGRDEVAAMGASFNAMADRIGDMITGQKELMAGVSHELRSPLTRMKVTLELLRQAGDASERLVDLEADVDAVDELVGELLLASRLELGSSPLEPVSLELAAVAGEAWTRVAAAAEWRRVALVVAAGLGARRIEADRALILRLLGNLFENAVRHAGEGEITLSSRRAGERVEITVADRGPGVDAEHLEHLFEPFYRVDGSRSRQTGAGGLGLMIVRRAVEAHGGRVCAEPVPGGGLAVVFDLPAAGPSAP